MMDIWEAAPLAEEADSGNASAGTWSSGASRSRTPTGAIL